MAVDPNPFPAADADRREIWDMLMRRDFTAFIAGDWSMTACDFVEDASFLGIDAGKHADPSRWTIAFHALAPYRESWLRQAADFARIELVGVGKLEFFYRAVRIERIDFAGRRALAHKVFSGSADAVDGSRVELMWRTLYHLVKQPDGWKIAGFIGYLPEPMPSSAR